MTSRGQVFVFFILTVAAAESAIGLAILVVLFRNLNTINVEGPGRTEGLSQNRESPGCTVPAANTTNNMENPLYLIVPLAPLAGAIIAGLFGPRHRPAPGAHWVTIIGVAVLSFAASVMGHGRRGTGRPTTFNGPVYTWLTSGEGALRGRFPHRPPDGADDGWW